MAFDGIYETIDDENIQEFFSCIGVPKSIYKIIQSRKPKLIILSVGDLYTLKIFENSDILGTVYFGLGTEFDDLHDKKGKIKCIITIENNKLVSRWKGLDYDLTRTLERDGNEATITWETSLTPIIAKRRMRFTSQYRY